MIWIGIDTGTNTGLAVWNGERFTEIATMPIHRAMERVKGHFTNALRMRDSVTVIFEDARQRKWFGRMTAQKDRARLQGAGSVKRDATIWQDFLTDYGIPFEAKAPKNNITKMSPDYFAKLTGWTGRTSEHARDAAMLVFGK
jgi:hypothetical protein